MMDFTNLLIINCKTTLWNKPSEQPLGQTNEIIAVDIASIDTKKNQIIEYDSSLIKPKQSKINEYCQSIFGINQSDLDKDGIQFVSIYRKLRVHYTSRDHIWCTWGSFTKNALEKQCRILELESLFTQSHIDLQRLYSVMIGLDTENNSISISQALQYSGINYNDNQAINMANIYMKMAHGLRQVPKTSRLIVPSGYGKV